MKDNNGYFTIIVWVKKRAYNKDRNPAGWDYNVQKQVEGAWVDKEEVRKEIDLDKA